jgi:hypothetical protein
MFYGSVVRCVCARWGGGMSQRAHAETSLPLEGQPHDGIV